MVMPDGMNGRQLAERLQATNTTLKVIFSSGYSQDFNSESFILEEGVNFLQNPLNKLLALSARALMANETWVH
jgi:CheY-like chemotaxis protein